MGNHDLLISSDNKGYASLGFEKLMKTQYVANASGGASGTDNFVAAFAQTDEGDAIADNFVFDKDMNGGNGPGQGVPYRYRAGTTTLTNSKTPAISTACRKRPRFPAPSSWRRRSRNSRRARRRAGPVDYRFFYADFTANEITDPVIDAGLYAGRLLSHPPRRCLSAFIRSAAGSVSGNQ